MVSYCLKWTKNTEIKRPKVVRKKKGRIIPLSKCAVCNKKKSKFLKDEEARGIWHKLTQSRNVIPW